MGSDHLRMRDELRIQSSPTHLMPLPYRRNFECVLDLDIRGQYSVVVLRAMHPVLYAAKVT